MIRPFLEHHAERIERTGQANALMNCHVVGLSSVMLHDEPGNRVRMFYANQHHGLYEEARADNPRMTLAVHPHRFDVRLSLIFGRVRNDTFRMERSAAGNFFECMYDSAILDGKGGLRKTGRRFIATDYSTRYLYSDTAQRMDARVLHSIYVPEGESAAWLVYEGAENRLYENLCYTTNPVFDATGMYMPMPANVAADLLRMAATRREKD